MGWGSVEVFSNLKELIRAFEKGDAHLFLPGTALFGKG